MLHSKKRRLHPNEAKGSSRLISALHLFFVSHASVKYEQVKEHRVSMIVYKHWGRLHWPEEPCHEVEISIKCNFQMNSWLVQLQQTQSCCYCWWPFLSHFPLFLEKSEKQKTFQTVYWFVHINDFSFESVHFRIFVMSFNPKRITISEYFLRTLLLLFVIILPT